METASVTSQTGKLIAKAIATRGMEIHRETRRIIETSGGFDLSGIHIHIGAEAAIAAKSLRARAFSISRHIIFGEGQFHPTSDAGLWLLAHEIAHAICQSEVPCSEYFVGGGGGIWEHWADAFAQFVLEGARPSQSWLRLLPVAPTGLVLRNIGPPCPKPPLWVPISAQKPEIWLTANNAIELSYKESHSNNVLIFGGDFRTGETITLPRNAKLSDTDRRFGNQLLLELAGLQWQLRPDIIDFTQRKFYEIKTAQYARDNPAKVIDQLANYYRITEAIRVKYAGPEWNPEAPDWYPPHMLPFNADPDRLVCTSATEYRTGKEFLNTLNRPGLILYSVLERAGSQERRKKRAQATRIVELATELAPVASFFQSQLRATLQEADDREYLIVCTREYLDAAVIPVGKANIARTLSLLNVPAMSIFQNPAIMMRLLGWSVIGISELLYFTVPAVVVLGPEEGIAAAVTVDLVLIHVPEAITGGMKAANDVVILAEAAGVLFLVGVAKEANAQSSTIPMDHVGMVKVIPLHSTWQLGTLSTGVKLEWAGIQFFYLGRASSSV